MRKSIVFHIIIALVLFASAASAQEGNISLNHRDVSLREVLDDIEAQSGMIFSYGNRLVDDNQLVSITVHHASLSDVLAQVFQDSSVDYMIIDKQIVLKRRKAHSLVNNNLDETQETEQVKYTINGYARDLNSGEVLIGANVFIGGGERGTVTNKYGYYSLTLEENFDSIYCNYVGYFIQGRAIGLTDQQVVFNLREQLQEIAEVSVYAEEEIESIRHSRSSDQRIRPSSVRKMPALLGEKDVIKSLAAIPGIKFFGDGSTIFYVRGGSRDQNLITVDEAPVYNAGHLMGFFSTIVPDAVKDIQVYKGDFPAKYGGRLSSMVDIRTKDGNLHEFGMDASIGLLSSRISLEGPLLKDRISYFISGRRSYILKPIQAAEPNVKDLHFADLHFKLNYIINSKNRIFFSLYRSEDNFESVEGVERRSGLNWSNSASTIRWNHLFSDRMFSNTTLFASRYDYFLNMNIEQRNYWNSHIDNVTLKSDFTYYISPENTLRFGFKLGQHYMNPGNYYEGSQLFALPFEISTRNANEFSIYGGNQAILYERLSVRAGIRLNSWSNLGPSVEYLYNEGRLDTAHFAAGEVYHNYVTGDPRLSMIYALSDRERLKFSYSRTSQFVNLITNSVSPFSTFDVWLPSGPRIKPQRADQVTFGYSRFFTEPGLKMEAEVYYKHMANQVDYRDHAQLIMNPLIENELRFGEGRAYGLETMISKKEGRLQGWFSYTLSRSFLHVATINQGNPYPSYGDRPHDLSLFLSYDVSRRLKLSGNFIYMTGAPFTSPTAFYWYENIQVPVYFKRNNDRLPDYHRLDVALNWDLRKREGKFKHELIFSVYNLYGRKNPVAIHFNKIQNKDEQLVIPYDFYSRTSLVSSQFYIYGMIPSVSYHFSF